MRAFGGSEGRPSAVTRVLRICLLGVCGFLKGVIPRLPLLFLSGTLYVSFGGLRIVVAENATGKGVLYLVVAACLAVEYDGVVAITHLLDSVLCLVLCVLTHLKPIAFRGLSLRDRSRLRFAPPKQDSERALRPSQRRFP